MTAVTSAERTALRALLVANPTLATEISKLREGLPTVGTTFYVDSVTGSNSYEGTSPGRPFATLVKALTMVTANQCDKIIILPTHVETLSGAAHIACATAGVEIIGLGQGRSRPTFTWSATTSTWTVTANSVSIKNIVCLSSIDEMVTMFSVTGTNCTLDAVDVYETASCQIIQFLLTTAAADYITVKNCYHIQLTAPTAVSKWIQLVGVDGARILDNYFRLVLANNAGSITISGSTACISAQVARNTIVQTGGTTQVSAILFVDSSTGTYVHDNRIVCGSTALAGGCDVGNAGYAAFNLVQNSPDTSGLLDPVADS